VLSVLIKLSLKTRYRINIKPAELRKVIMTSTTQPVRRKLPEDLRLNWIEGCETERNVRKEKDQQRSQYCSAVQTFRLSPRQHRKPPGVRALILINQRNIDIKAGKKVKKREERPKTELETAPMPRRGCDRMNPAYQTFENVLCATFTPVFTVLIVFRIPEHSLNVNLNAQASS